MTRRRNDRNSAEVKLFLLTCHLVCEYFRCLLTALSHHKGFDLAHDIKRIHLSYTSFIRLKLLANLQRATDKQGQSSNWKLMFASFNNLMPLKGIFL